MAKSKQGAKRVKSVALMAAAAMTAQIAVGVASVARGADVMIGTEWTPVVNENGHTYFSGFTDYNGGIPTTTLQQVARNGDNWLKYTNQNAQYWGELVGQSWANTAVSTASVNA